MPRVPIASEAEQEVFVQKLEALRPQMERTAHKRVHEIEYGNELAQRAIIKAWQNMDKFRQEAGLSTWVTRILINEHLRDLRTARSRPKIEPLLREDGTTRDIPIASRMDKDLAIEEAMVAAQKLRPALRTALLLNLKGFSYKEIADEIGCSQSASKTTLFRARKAMQERFPEIQQSLRQSATVLLP